MRGKKRITYCQEGKHEFGSAKITRELVFSFGCAKCPAKWEGQALPVPGDEEVKLVGDRS